MKVLHEYHHALGLLIDRYEGTLERFAGDGLLTLFNDPLPCPDHTSRAVHMAVEMRSSIEHLSKSWRKRGHDLGFGIGIALGYATLGQIGFERRLDYSAVGTVTNLASRLCDEAKAGQIIVDQRVFNIIEESFDSKPIGTLTLKGLRRPIEAFEIIGART
jgi:class 3 adenylate cyclase